MAFLSFCLLLAHAGFLDMSTITAGIATDLYKLDLFERSLKANGYTNYTVVRTHNMALLRVQVDTTKIHHFGEVVQATNTEAAATKGKGYGSKPV